MPIPLTCPHCRKHRTLPDSLAGKAAKCGCGAVLRIPARADGVPTPPPAPSLFDELSAKDLRTMTQMPSVPATNSSISPRPLRTASRDQHQARHSPSLRTIALIVGGVAATILMVACCGGLYSLTQPPVPSAAALELLAYDSAKLPPLPERGTWMSAEPQVLEQQVSLSTASYQPAAGLAAKLIAYLPAGEHPPKSLPCILITGAGSTLLTGMALGEGDRAEHLPYVHAGFAVIAYELDGAPDETNNLAQRPYNQFRQSQAGLQSDRLALEFALQKMPEIDPAQIYAAGHSSAATHALLFAEYEPRLAGVIAYAPVVDVPRSFGAALRIVSWQLPGVIDFATQSSPHTHIASLKCPTFLFQAEDDPQIPLTITKTFAERLKQQQTDVKFVTVPSGGHYDAMINEGIPAAIQWLRERPRLP